MKLPWFKFSPSSWLQDAALRRCSHAAKGVWIDMVCLMYQCEEVGVLATAGKAWSDDDIARAVGGDRADTLSCIQSLLDYGVAHRNATGAVYSKRVVRDEERRRRGSTNGEKGGNPSLRGLSQPSNTLNSPLSVSIGSDSEEIRAPELPPQSQWRSPSDTRAPGWMRFFDAYPNGSRRKNLHRLWDQLGMEKHTEAVLAGLERWKASERWREGYVLGMREFMENSMWEDQPPVGKSKPASKREEGTAW